VGLELDFRLNATLSFTEHRASIWCRHRNVVMELYCKLYVPRGLIFIGSHELDLSASVEQWILTSLQGFHLHHQ
jgi:hypothetical protein